jgi:hypothetical protein
MIRRVALPACLAVSVIIGAVREFVFINLNYQLDHVARNTPVSYAHTQFQAWVAGWSLRSLILLKWAMALAFIAAMCALCVLLARALFASRRYDRPVLVAFAGIALLSLVLHALAPLMPPLELVSVKLLHALQYPVLLMFIWAASWLRPAAQKG